MNSFMASSEGISGSGHCQRPVVRYSAEFGGEMTRNSLRLRNGCSWRGYEAHFASSGGSVGLGEGGSIWSLLTSSATGWGR